MGLPSLSREQMRVIMEGSGCWQCPLWLREGTSCSAPRAPNNRMKGAVNRCCRLYLGYRTCLQWKWGSWHGERVRCDTVQQAEWNRQHTPFYTTLHVHYVINQFRQTNTLWHNLTYVTISCVGESNTELQLKVKVKWWTGTFKIMDTMKDGQYDKMFSISRCISFKVFKGGVQGSLKRFQGVPQQKMGIIYFHYNSIH